ncbi:MAG: hypothetical protein KGQ44_06950 [Betaproteobacteria bacterium]|nr:hypothetical protein [Betaproteobacteria bacterium]
MIKTFFVDSGKGGTGKTLLCHLLVDFYLNHQESGLSNEEYPLVLFDADLSHKDFSTYPIRMNNGKLIPCYLVDLSLIEGWQFIERKVNRFLKNDQQARAIVNCPNHFLSLLQNTDPHEIGALMSRIHTLPLWIMNNSPANIDQLQLRQRLLPKIYQHGIAILNLHHSRSSEFYSWHCSLLREHSVKEDAWIETTLPALNRVLSRTFTGMPINQWLEYGFNGEGLSFGYQLALKTFRYETRQRLIPIESLSIV